MSRRRYRALDANNQVQLDRMYGRSRPDLREARKFPAMAESSVPILLAGGSRSIPRRRRPYRKHRGRGKWDFRKWHMPERSKHRTGPAREGPRRQARLRAADVRPREPSRNFDDAFAARQRGEDERAIDFAGQRARIHPG